MKIIKILYITLSFLLVTCIQSCKKTGKEVAEKALSESVEKVAKNIIEESSEKTLRSITKKELKNLDWESLLKVIKQQNINISESLLKFDGSFQKKIGKAFTDDYDFYTAIVSSNTIFDEFAVFVKNAPKVSRDINMLRYFAKCKDLERRFGVPDALSNVLIKEENGTIKFLNKNSRDIIAELRDGIVSIKNPFDNTGNLLTEESLLKKELIPNSAYRIRESNGLSYLYHIDNLGRIEKIEANCIDADALLTNIIQIKENLNLGNEWASHLKRIKQNSKGRDIKATINLKYLDDETTPNLAKTEIIANNKKIVSQSFKNLDNVSTSIFSTTANAKTLNSVASRVGINTKKKS